VRGRSPLFPGSHFFLPVSSMSGSLLSQSFFCHFSLHPVFFPANQLCLPIQPLIWTSMVFTPLWPLGLGICVPPRRLLLSLFRLTFLSSLLFPTPESDFSVGPLGEHLFPLPCAPLTNAVRTFGYEHAFEAPWSAPPFPLPLPDFGYFLPDRVDLVL